MAHRVARMTADDGAVWLMGLGGRRWVCDCGGVDEGRCHGWALRGALERVRERIRYEWLRVRGSEDDVGLLRREAVLGAAEWKRAARKVLADRMSLPAVGIRLKGLLLVRPGLLGEFLRVFPSCRVTAAPSASLRLGRDPMPLPLLEESLAESRFALELRARQEGASLPRKER